MYFYLGRSLSPLLPPLPSPGPESCGRQPWAARGRTARHPARAASSPRTSSAWTSTSSSSSASSSSSSAAAAAAATASVLARLARSPALLRGRSSFRARAPDAGAAWRRRRRRRRRRRVLRAPWASHLGPGPLRTPPLGCDSPVTRDAAPLRGVACCRARSLRRRGALFLRLAKEQRTHYGVEWGGLSGAYATYDRMGVPEEEQAQSGSRHLARGSPPRYTRNSSPHDRRHSIGDGHAGYEEAVTHDSRNAALGADSPPALRKRSPSPEGSATAALGYNSEDEYDTGPSTRHGTTNAGAANIELGTARHQVYGALADERGFAQALRTYRNLEIHPMQADGNCLFRAVSHQVYGDQELHGDVRQLCFDYMEDECEYYSQFVTENFGAYVRRKRRDKVYGNNLEMQALAELFNRPIQVYSYSLDPINIFHGGYETDLPPMKLSYHRGNHYNSLVDPSNSTVGAGTGLPGINIGGADSTQVKRALAGLEDGKERRLDQALVDEGILQSDKDATEEAVTKAVMAASREEFLVSQDEKHSHRPLQIAGSSRGESSSNAECTAAGQPARAHQNKEKASSGYVPPDDSPAIFSGVDSGVATLLSMGFDNLTIMEAQSVVGEDLNHMLNYILQNSGYGVDSRGKGKQCL
eukprot:scaffold2270_cov362-Prasinococcus_capsulatus_cf.AAC.6